MFVGERMTFPVVMVSPDMPIQDALQLMKRERIRRAPVVKDGALVGIVSDKDLLYASPSPATSLSVWELNYLLSKVTVDQVMTTKIITVAEETTIEEAARIMADSKIGGMPVVRGKAVVGIITETDVFRLMLEMMGAREQAVRVTALVSDRLEELVDLANAIAGANGKIIALGTFDKDSDHRELVVKISGLEKEKVAKLVDQIINVQDIRYC
jgi:acetoin utilization protein AcuB